MSQFPIARNTGAIVWFRLTFTARPRLTGISIAAPLAPKSSFPEGLAYAGVRRVHAGHGLTQVKVVSYDFSAALSASILTSGATTVVGLWRPFVNTLANTCPFACR